MSSIFYEDLKFTTFLFLHLLDTLGVYVQSVIIGSVPSIPAWVLLGISIRKETDVEHR